MADAVEAMRQDVDQKAADELAGLRWSWSSAVRGLGAIVLPFEGDAAAIERKQPAVGNGDAMGIARQIGEYRLGSAERAL